MARWSKWSRWFVLAIILFGAGFGIGRAYIGWTKVVTPCDDIQALGGTANAPMVVCADEPGVIQIKQ